MLSLGSPFKFYFSSMSVWEEKRLLKKEVFALPQESVSLYNKAPADNLISSAQIDSISRADFSSKATICWK